MKQEYIKKLKLAKKLLVWDTTLPNDVLDSNVDKGCDLLEELVTIQDTDVLVGLLDFFTDENEDYGGVCERLENDIYVNFTMSQIVYALVEKFEYLVENDLDRLAGMTIAVVNTGYFEMLRKLLNEKKFVVTGIYIEALTKFKNHILDRKYANILREDMKKW